VLSIDREWKRYDRCPARQDVDLVILPGPDYPRGQQPATYEEAIWPFLDVLAAADQDDIEAWSMRDFGTDRMLHPKGGVEAPLSIVFSTANVTNARAIALLENEN
jgi:hypothetical protein